MFDMTKCHDADDTCVGELELTVSASGCTRVMRCAVHAVDYRARMDALQARLDRDYPAQPPAWFDPAYAGESWDED
jgi:hypothetical protein